MTELEQLLAMLRNALAIYNVSTRTPSADAVFTVVELDPGRHAYSFIFNKDGKLLTTEPSGY
jgi:hypothetical protein